MHLIARLDDHYALQGELVAARQSLRHGRWTAQQTGRTWRRAWVHNFPAAYSGPVYLQLQLPRSRLPAELGVQLRWGPWFRKVTIVVLDETGRTLAFSKGDDGLSVPLRVRLDRPGLALFARGPAPGFPLDINAGWTWTGE